MSALMEPPVIQEAELSSAERSLGQMMARPSVDRFRGVSSQLPVEAKDVLLGVLADDLKACIPLVQGLPQRAYRQWQRLCSFGWQGFAEKVHEARPVFLKTTEERLRMAERVLDLARFYTALSGQVLPEEAEFHKAKRDLEAFMGQVFGRWSSLEDLEDRLAESFPLTHQELEAIGKDRFPPDDWFLIDEAKPF